MRTKEKISISIDKLLLERVDKMIDGRKIRNRSQAIEAILKERLMDDKISAIILAGGGRKAFKNGILKTLHVIRRKPILVHILEWLKGCGISDIWIAADEEEQIRKVWKDARFFQDERKGTAGLVKRFLEENGRAMVISGDVYFEMNCSRFISHHLHLGKMATMAVTTTKREKSKDAILLEGSEIIKFSYQPKERTYLVNAGIAIFEERAADAFPSKGSLERHVFPRLAAMGELAAFHFSGRWVHVD